MTIEVNSKQVGSEAVLRIAGDIDAHTSPLLRRELIRLFAASLQTIRVQLDDVSQLDSSAIATLSEGLAWSRKQGGHFVLSGVGRQVADVLALSKLDQEFEIEATQVEDAGAAR